MPAISRNQVGKFSTKDERQLDYLELVINNRLNENYQLDRPSTYVVITLAEIKSWLNSETIKPALLNRLLADYRKKEWTVEVVEDQRDGDYLRFS